MVTEASVKSSCIFIFFLISQHSIFIFHAMVIQRAFKCNFKDVRLGDCCRDSFDLCLPPRVMHLRLRAQPFSRLLGREVPLRVGQHLVPHHELLDSGGPQ